MPDYHGKKWNSAISMSGKAGVWAWFSSLANITCPNARHWPSSSMNCTHGEEVPVAPNGESKAIEWPLSPDQHLNI
jgi:hypothetical protein